VEPERTKLSDPWFARAVMVAIILVLAALAYIHFPWWMLRG
jgi:hypothetical protein